MKTPRSYDRIHKWFHKQESVTMPGEQFQIYNFDIFRKIFISACTHLVLNFQYLNSKPPFIIPAVNIIFEIMLCACFAIYLYLEWMCFPSAAKIIRTKLSTISIIIVSFLNIDFHLLVKLIKFISNLLP